MYGLPGDNARRPRYTERPKENGEPETRRFPAPARTPSVKNRIHDMDSTYSGVNQASAQDEVRHGDWMQTFSGKAFWPLDPRPEEVDIRDIAHALSMQCRYAGHCLRFYSVAEHCVMLVYEMRRHTRRLQIDLLLHDAAEAYLVDVPRPVKRYLTGYREAEARVDAAIRKHFVLFRRPHKRVKALDNAILHDEQAQNMAPSVRDWNLPGGPLGVSLHFWSPAEAEAAFLACARYLGLRGA